MRSSRGTTPHVAENSVVDDATDDCSLRGIFATFLADSSASLRCPYFYLIQSNGWKSLCLLTGLSVQDYSKLLLLSKLVRVRTNKDGSRLIWVVRDDWNTILGRFELRGDIYGKGGCVELTDGKIKHAAIERTMGGRIEHTTTNQKSASLAGNVADMSRHVADDTSCRSNFGQMGPCRRHFFLDVVAVCVGLSRHLPDF